MKILLSLTLLILLIGCSRVDKSVFPAYYYGMSHKQFVETYPSEIVCIHHPVHGEDIKYYIPDKGVAILRFSQKRGIRKIIMREATPYELEIATVLLKRREAERESK